VVFSYSTTITGSCGRRNRKFGLRNGIPVDRAKSRDDNNASVVVPGHLLKSLGSEAIFVLVIFGSIAPFFSIGVFIIVWLGDLLFPC
jgi:hypothetical protein